MNRIYNEEIKEKFLSTFENEQTQKTIRNIFYKTKLVESVLDKDIYDFNLDEIGKAIENCNPHNRGTARSTGRFIGQYISWAMPYRETNLNPLSGIELEWYDKFVDKTKKVHYSYDEFIELLEDLPNSQDQAALALMFMGALGNTFDELRNIKLDDIDWDNNTITLTERNNEVIHIDDEKFMRYISNASKAETYHMYNEDEDDHTEKELLPSEYLFKNIKSTRSIAGKPVAPSVFYSRLANIKKEFELEYLTPNALKQSGMIFLSHKLFDQYGEINPDMLKVIGEKYDYSKVVNNGFEMYNYALMREFINEEKLNELYHEVLEH